MLTPILNEIWNIQSLCNEMVLVSYMEKFMENMCLQSNDVIPIFGHKFHDLFLGSVDVSLFLNSGLKILVFTSSIFRFPFISPSPFVEY